MRLQIGKKFGARGIVPNEVRRLGVGVEQLKDESKCTNIISVCKVRESGISGGGSAHLKHLREEGALARLELCALELFGAQRRQRRELVRHVRRQQRIHRRSDVRLLHRLAAQAAERRARARAQQRQPVRHLLCSAREPQTCTTTHE